jgi:N-acetylglucosamine-6-phosphate deacetylase
MQLVNARLVLPDEIVRGTLAVRGGCIQKISKAAGKTSSQTVRPDGTIDLKGGFLAPGFVDLHIHGAMGHDTMEATPQAFRAITEFHLRGGTTSLSLTTLTAPHADILRVLDAVRPLRNRTLGGARIIGVHVEGPYISPKRAGAQNPKFVRPPNKPAEWRELLRFGRLITQMTIAPEEQGALALIRALRRNGTIASGGHTDANHEHLIPALKAGLNHATHTFNQMSTITKRGPYRWAGMIEFALAHDEILCELICDGQHVPPIIMKMLFNAKGRDGVCLVTDASSGAGLPAGTKFELYGMAVRTTQHTAELVDGTGLAGSTLTMIRAVKTAVELGGQTLVDAVRMASLNPARQLGRANEFGSLEVGKRADLVWFDERFRVRGVWLDGDIRFLA